MEAQIAKEDADLACVFQAEEDVVGGDDPSPQWTVPEEEGQDDEEEEEGGATAGNGTPLEERTACIVVDPFSHFLGKRLKRQALAKGLACVDVLCPYTSVSLGPGTKRWRSPAAGQEVEWAAQMPFKKVAFILSESDVGTATAERLQVALGVRGSGVNPARRNKYLTNLALKARGAGEKSAPHQRWNSVCVYSTCTDDSTPPHPTQTPASTRQLLTGDWAEAERFLTKLQHDQQQHQLAADTGVPFAVVKPVRGAASGDVYVCMTMAEAKAAFDAILNAPTYGGGLNEAVLVQEYVRGQEWAVDTVSRDGEAKVLAVWRYDKRRANGAPCVYFGTWLEAAPPGSKARRVADYAVKEVLPALGVAWGPTHTEVIMREEGSSGSAAAAGGPVVVECNCRWHLCNFLPCTDACLGTNAVDATLDAFVDADAWARVPAMPETVSGGNLWSHHPI